MNSPHPTAPQRNARVSVAISVLVVALVVTVLLGWHMHSPLAYNAGIGLVFLGAATVVVPLAGLLGAAVYLAQSARMQTRLAERVREDLKHLFRLAPDILRSLAEPRKNVVHPDDRAATEVVVQGQKTVSTFALENRDPVQDGSYRWLHWNSLHSPERETTFGAARDGTAEKVFLEALKSAAEELARRLRERTAELEDSHRALHEREELFRSLFEDSPRGTAMADLDCRLTHVNKALCELLGYNASELVGLSLADITRTDDSQPGFALLRQMVAGRIPGYRLTGRYLRKNGEMVWGDLTATILRDPRGTPLTVLGMTENVAARQQYDEEIARLTRELQKRAGELTAVNQELESFNYSISHNLRAPLRHIDGFSKILVEDYGPEMPDEARRYLDLVCEGARRMARMVDELLELSRTSRKPVARQTTGLQSIVDDVLEELKPELEGRHIEWRVGELPSVHCDPKLTRQVFRNLLSNAAKFSGSRQLAIIEVGQRRPRGQTVLFVRDNGVGFSMKYADQLFGVFQRLHRRGEFEGNGVGLATVQRIIHKHGGRIWAEAEPDTGATFYFTLEPPGDQCSGTEQEEVAVLQRAS
jgi:PAS domain S-box-containing protein